MGAQLLKEASQKQVDAVGDGTTAVMVLAQAIIQEAFLLIAAGISPMALRKGLEEATMALEDELLSMAIPVKSLNELKHIASISAEDQHIGSLIANTLYELGEEGTVDAIETKQPDTTVDIQKGLQLDEGWKHQLFVTNPSRMEAVVENAYILVTDKPVTSLIPLQKLIEYVGQNQLKLVIITPDLSGEALELLLQHKLAGRLHTLGIKAPSFGEDQKNILQDIAIVTGGKFITEDAGLRFEDVTVDDLGFAEHVTATKTATIISGGKGKKKDVDARVESIKAQLAKDPTEFDMVKMKARLGKLGSGVAVVRVGGHTEVEMKERRERVIDSIAATRAAMKDGIVPGGEMVYLHIRKSCENKILYKALAKPYKKLIQNADLDEVELALKLDKKGQNYGVDVTDGQVKDLLKAGIVDPVAVPLNALRNAVSVAIQIITTGTTVVPEVVEKK
jgi:chaperonin GroEL